MADKHPSGNPDLVEQHKKIQQEGDEDLAGTAREKPRQKRSDEEKSGEREISRDSDNSGSRPGGGSFVGP